MRKIVPLIFIISILILPNILAGDLIADSKITIKAYNSSKYSGNSIMIKFEITNGDYSVNNRNYTLNVTTNKATSNLYDFLFQMAKNGTSIDEKCTYNQNITKCIIEKRDYERSYQICKLDLEEYNNGTYDCKKSFDLCENTIIDKDSDIAELNEKIQTLIDGQKTTKNAKWIFGIVGLILGAAGYAFKNGKLGNKVRDKQADDWNPGVRS